MNDIPILEHVVGPVVAKSIREYFVEKVPVSKELVENSQAAQERMCRAFEQAYDLLENSITSVEMIDGVLTGHGQLLCTEPRMHGVIICDSPDPNDKTS